MDRAHDGPTYCRVSVTCPVADAAQLLVALNVPVIVLPVALIVIVPFAFAEHAGYAAVMPAGIVIVNVKAFPDTVPVMPGIAGVIIIPGNDIVPVTCVPFCVSVQVIGVVPVTIPLPIIVPFDAIPVPVQVPENEEDADGGAGEVGTT